MISTYQKCFCSGILACIGSVFAKWAFGDISLDDIYHFKIVIIRLLSLFCMIYFNTKGLTLFIENLKEVSTPIGVVLNTSGNILSSGLIGYVLGEKLTLNWIIGATLIMIGTWIIHRKSQNSNPKKTD